MTYLLDTAPFLWAVGNPERLSTTARKLIEDPKNALLVSVASLWEVVVKAQKGLLSLNDPPVWLQAGIASLGAEIMPVRAAHAYSVGQLPMIHKDPIDRLLVAQAVCEGCVLITSDSLVRQYKTPTVW